MTSIRDTSLALLQQLTEAHSAPGAEDDVRRLVQTQLRDGFDFDFDRMGGIFATSAAANPSETVPHVVLAGHMDEVGFMVQDITADGFIRFVPLGGWWSHTLLAQRVKIRTEAGADVLGVITSLPPHFLGADAREQVVPIDKLYMDIGAENRAQVEEDWGIQVGDAIVPEVAFSPLQHPDRFMAKAFDNRVGMGLAIQAMQSLDHASLPCRVTGVGTVQEEVGVRGATVAGHALHPDVVLVLEGPPADDTPGCPPGEIQGKLGGGVQIRVSDPSALMNRKLVSWVRECAREAGIPHQITVRRSGGTDARSFQLAHEGVPVIVLGVPARYIHTHNAIIDIHDYLAALDLVKALVPRLDTAAVASLTDFA